MILLMLNMIIRLLKNIKQMKCKIGSVHVLAMHTAHMAYNISRYLAKDTSYENK